jgi:signal transduction histidine kinase
VIVEQERNRIARDMHDVVAHSLAVVIAQADGARYARAADPDAVDGALVAISTTAREALGDVRVLLTQLRHSDSDGPQPSLADLDALLAQLTGAGVRVRKIETGQPRELPASVQLAVYRIAQEALTNALRHGADGAPVLVHLAWSEAELILIVTNTPRIRIDANPHSRPDAGHGIPGMRERALLSGGSFDVRRETELFTIEARVPIGTRR